MTYRVLFRYFTVLNALSQREMPATTALALGVRMGRFRELFDALDRERLKLLRSYASKGEDGKLLKTENGGYVLDDPEEYNDAWSALLDQEIPELDLPEVAPISGEFAESMTPLEWEALVAFGLYKQPEE